MAGPTFTARWDGVARFEQQLKMVFKEILEGAASALFIEAEEVMTEAKIETPVDEGPLRASGHVQLPIVQPTVVDVELGFGGPAGAGNQGETNDKDVGYAVYVHENLTAKHPVGKAKFLEDPIKRRQGSMPARAARRIDARRKK